MDRQRCIRTISDAGLPVPPKSACFFCAASHKWEIELLKNDHPHLYALAVEMERRYREGPHFRGDSHWTIRAKHKETGETQTMETQAADAAGARAQFRAIFKDERPYTWKLSCSRAVPGLGRSFAWSKIEETA